MLIERLGRASSISGVDAGECVAFSFGDVAYVGIRTDWVEQGDNVHQMVASIYPADPDLKNMPGLLDASVFGSASLYVLPNVHVSVPLLLPELRIEPSSFAGSPGSLFLAESNELIMIVRYQIRNVMLDVQSGQVVRGKRPAVWFSKCELVHRVGDEDEVICTISPSGSQK